MAESVIETGVDKLVELVKSSKRISVPDAAKSLSVSRVVIQEWANFLEEEGIISIEYKFTTPYLVERQMSKKEVEEKIKDFSGMKEGFVRKAEVTLSLLDKKGEVFSQLKEDFRKLKEELGDDLSTVQGQINNLEKFHTEKQSIDKEIKEQEAGFRQKIQQMDTQIALERKHYSEIVSELGREQQSLDKERIEALSLKEMTKALDATMKRFTSTVEQIKTRLSDEDHSIDNTEQHISRLKKLADQTQRDIQQRSSQLNSLLAKSKEQEQRIQALQRQIIQKSAKRCPDSKSGSECTERLKRFFAHNKEIEEYLAKIHNDKQSLQKELTDIIRKARAFQLATKSKDVRGYVSELQKKFDTVERHKQQFEGEVSKLRSILR